MKTEFPTNFNWQAHPYWKKNIGNKILIRTAKAAPGDLEIRIEQITMSTTIIIFENSEKVMKLLSHTYVKKEQHKQNRYPTITYHSGMLLMQKTTLSLFCEWYLDFQSQQTKSESSKTGTFLPALIFEYELPM